MFYRKWKVKNIVVSDVQSAGYLEAFLIKHGVLFFLHASTVLGMCNVLMGFKSKQQSVWSNVFWYIQVCIFCKLSQYTIYWDKTKMLKNFLWTK